MPGVVTTPFKERVPVESYTKSTGTWSTVTNSGLPYISKSAAAETTKVSIPLKAISRDTEDGAELTAIDIPVRVGTANLASTPTVTLYRRNASLAATGAGTNMTASTVACTVTGATVTSATTDRLIHVALNSAIFDYSKDAKADYRLELVFHTATTSTLRVYDAISYYSVPL